MVNAGGGYDVNQNWFTCPVSGFYLFTMSTAGDAGSGGVDNGIVMDDTPIAGLVLLF